MSRQKFLESLSSNNIDTILKKIKHERNKLSHDLMFAKGQTAIQHHRSDIVYTPELFENLNNEFKNKQRENDKSIQASNEILEIDKKLDLMENINPKYMTILNKINTLETSIKRNAELGVKCPSCCINVGDELNKELENKLYKYKKYKNVKDIHDIPAELKRCETIVSQTQKLNTHREFLSSNVIPLHNIEQLKIDVDYLSLFSNISTDTVDKLSKRLDSLDSLKDYINKAQALYNKNIIDTMTDYTNQFLKGFFEAPISFLIISIIKGGKSQIDFEIKYNGLKTNLKSLSGGEFDRVLLAITLGINKMYNIPFLLLDETLGSLDSETMSMVIHTTKMLYNGTCVYIGHVDDSDVFDSCFDVC
jgi:DNA repair ATPase RecN